MSNTNTNTTTTISLNSGAVDGTSNSGTSNSSNSSSSGLLTLNLSVRHDHLLEDARTVALALFPAWTSDADAGQLDLVQCKDGITNKLVKVRNTRTNECILIRSYGHNSSVLIDRGQEVRNMRTLANLGLCPPLYAKIQGGLVYGYIEGRVVAVPEMADKHISMLIAKKLAEWHTTAEPPTISPSPSVQGSPAVTVSANGNGASLAVPKVPNGIHYDQFGAGGHQSKLFVTLRKWLGAVPAKYDNPQKQALFAASFNVDELAAELDMLEEHLASLNSPIVFCHNDLLSANIIYNPECDQVAFIDYEYGAFGPRGFDIGNHFAEYAGFECEYDRVPNRRQQLTWLSTYFEAAYDRKPEKSELEALFVEANKYLLVSHVYWGLWALVQAKLSDIDFDYLGYAKMRFEEYHNDRDFILSLKVSQ